jgi:hypothetical protein
MDYPDLPGQRHGTAPRLPFFNGLGRYYSNTYGELP